jgi:dihydropyrimidinase
MSYDLLVTGGTLVAPDAVPRLADVAIKDGKVVALLPAGAGAGAVATHSASAAPAAQLIDATGLHVFPGLIDCHVHFGFGEPITEYATETSYAAQGGFTSIVAYLLNNDAYGPVIERELGYARSRAHVDFGLHFSTATELHLQELASYVRDHGVTSFKYFMNFKGEEGRYLGLDGTDDGYLYALLQEAARIGGLMMVIHTENIEVVNRVRREIQASGKATLRDWSHSKPPFTESESLLRASYFAEQTGATIYVPHLSSALALAEARRWRQRYPHIFLETCPHYLTHTENSDIGSIGKANPPFRTRADVEALWEALADGSVDTVASDHVPRKRSTKEKGIWQASQGFPGTATILPVLLSEGYHKRRLGLQRIAQLLCHAPAKLFGLAGKGALAPGADADLTLVDVNRERVVSAAELGSYADYSLYDGWLLKGWPVRTIVRGLTVMQDGRIVGPAGHGRYLRRSAAAAP